MRIKEIGEIQIGRICLPTTITTQSLPNVVENSSCVPGHYLHLMPKQFSTESVLKQSQGPAYHTRSSASSLTDATVEDSKSRYD